MIGIVLFDTDSNCFAFKTVYRNGSVVAQLFDSEILRLAIVEGEDFLDTASGWCESNRLVVTYSAHLESFINPEFHLVLVKYSGVLPDGFIFIEGEELLEEVIHNDTLTALAVHQIRWTIKINEEVME